MSSGSPAVPDRIRYAVEGLGLDPDGRVLEVGGGNGVAAALIVRVLAAGRGFLLGVDRSRTATAAATARNADAVAAGTAAFLTGALVELDTRAHRGFDRVLAVNVNTFWTGPALEELGVLRRALQPEGELHLVYQPPAAGRRATLRHALVAHLGAAGWTADVDETDGAPPLLRVVARAFAGTGA